MARSYSKILVTGGAGFIGSHIVDRLLSEHFEVTLIDNLTSGSLENVEHHRNRENFHFIRGDILNLDLVRSALKCVDAVFHEAALVSVTRSVEDPVLANKVNVKGTLTLLKACLESDVRRFIYASSSSVYGESEALPKRESLLPQPISPYGVSKLAAESYVKVFHKVYGLETVCLRYFNVYGSRQKFGPYSGVITIFINRLLRGQTPIIYGDGEQTRDFTNVMDVVDANMLALMKQSAVGEIFNVASGVATSVNQLASMLQEITGKKNLTPTHTDPRLGDIRHSYADINKAKKILGHHPKVQLREGLIKLVNWFTKRSSKNR